MDKNAFDLEFEITEFHWWFVARRKILTFLLSSVNPYAKGPVLDIGCGVGSNLPVLVTHGLNALGLDRSLYALTLASTRFRIALMNGDVAQLPIRPGSIGLIIATDVLEHLENDSKAIRQMYQTLMEGGVLIVTVPAFGFLWGTQDTVTGHRRRYRRHEVLHKLRQQGFDIVRSSYFNFFLFFPILIGRLLVRVFRLKLESENMINSPWLNAFLREIFSFEPYLLKHISFPFGVSIFCVAQK
jgi:SAM-dependent methyltransferase